MIFSHDVCDISPRVDYKEEPRVYVTEINRNRRPRASYRKVETKIAGIKRECRVYDQIPRPSNGVWTNVVDWDKQAVKLGPGDFAVSHTMITFSKH